MALRCASFEYVFQINWSSNVESQLQSMSMFLSIPRSKDVALVLHNLSCVACPVAVSAGSGGAAGASSPAFPPQAGTEEGLNES